MPYPRFLLDGPMHGPGEYQLGRMESHHAATVLRLKKGDVAIVFDGEGNYAEALITDVERSGVTLQVDGVRTEAHLPLMLTIATAIPKGKRWQMLVEKCTELGVDRIIPLLSDRSVARGEGDVTKWRRWVVEAAKQCRRYRLPDVLEPVTVPAVVAMARQEKAFLLVADAEGETPSSYRGIIDHVFQAMVAIGPEGGFTAAERQVFVDNGAKTIRLSPFTLRVETAAATACAILREILL